MVLRDDTYSVTVFGSPLAKPVLALLSFPDLLYIEV